MRRKALFLFCAGIFLITNAYAETITLKSGQQIEGKIIRKSDAIVTVDLGNRIEVYMLNEITKISDENTALGAPVAGTSRVTPSLDSSTVEKDNIKRDDFLKGAQEFNSLNEDQQKEAMAQAILNPSDKSKRSMAMFAGIFFVIAFIAGIILHVYYAICLQLIAKKTNQGLGWLAWIPIANIFLMLNIAGIKYRWLLLIFVGLIPFVGGLCVFGLSIYIWYKIILARNKPLWLTILMIVPVANLAVMGYLAFSE